VLPTRIKEAVITCQVEIGRILYGAGIHVCPGAPSARLSCVFFARSC
jgi:cytochrome P450